MTAEWNEMVNCGRCGYQVSTEQPIKAWIRGHAELDSVRHCLCIGDSDLWVQRYGTRWSPRQKVNRDVMYLMLIEIKTHLRHLDEPQRDLLFIVDQLLRNIRRRSSGGRFELGHEPNARRVISVMAGRPVEVLCYGVHLLRMSAGTPAESQKIWWDRKEISRNELIEVLRFDLSPDTRRPMEHRSRKRGQDVDMLPGLEFLVRRGGAHVA